MGKIIIDEGDLLESMEEVIGKFFYNERSEIYPPFEHLAEHCVHELSIDLMDDIMKKIKEIGEAVDE